MENKSIHILIVEDNPADARLIVEMLMGCSDLAFETECAKRLDQALQVLEHKDFDAVLLDLNLPDSRGLKGLERIVAQEPHLPVVMLTGLDDEAVGLEALQRTASDYLVKGKIDEQLLRRSILYAIERKRTDAEIHGINARLAVHAAKLEEANETLKQSRLAALNLMDDALLARRNTEEALDKLRRTQEDLARAQEVGQLGSWRLDIPNNTLIWSDESYRIFGISKDIPMTYETFLSAVYPDDRKYVDTRWKAALAGDDYDIEHRIVVDGRVKWVREKAHVEFDDKGEPLSSFGIIQDITYRKQIEDKIRDLAKFPAENPYPVMRLSKDGTLLYSNRPGRVLLQDWNCNIGQKVPQKWCRLIERSLRESRMLIEQVKCDNQIFSFAINPIGEGGYVNLYGRDITVQEKAKEVLRRSRDELEIRVKERTVELAKAVIQLQEEVEQRRHAEESLRKRSRDLDAFFSHSITPLVILDREFNFIRVNQVYADADHRDVSEFEGHSYFEFYPHEENKRIFEEVVRTKTPSIVFARPFSFPDHPEWGVTYWDWTLVPVLGDAGEVDLLIFSLKDVTEEKRAEIRKETTNSLLELFVEKTSRKEYLDAAVEIIRDWSGCRCVGLRLIDEIGCIPYATHVGFNEDFLSRENRLSLKKDNCVCTRVIAQTPPSKDTPAVTEKGSFCCGNLSDFIASLSAEEKKQFRGGCVQNGYASLAVVPISYGQKVIGAIHLADERENMIPSDVVEFLEDMALLIGEAIHRFTIEESLRLNEKRLLEAQRIAGLGNWEMDIATNQIWWSDEVYEIFGLERGTSLTRDTFLSCVHPEDRKRVEDSAQNALDGGHAHQTSHRIIRPDGSERVVDEKAEIVYDSNHEPIKMIGTVHDITEQRKAENLIRANQEALRELTAELLRVEEKERRRIAVDLHDSLGQLLALSSLEVDKLRKSAPETLQPSLEDIWNHLNQAIREARTLSFDLSPGILYDLGFAAAVEDLVDRIGNERHIQTCFEDSASPKPLTADVKVLLYRSIRELLINSAKHSKADCVKVRLLRSSSNICVEIEDDGKGFDVSILREGLTERKGFGLFSIRERLDHIGGRLEIESSEGRGTKAIITAPLQIDVEDEPDRS